MHLEWHLCQPHVGVLPSFLLPQYILVGSHWVHFKVQERQRALLLLDWLIMLRLICSICRISCIFFTWKLEIWHLLTQYFCNFSTLIVLLCLCAGGSCTLCSWNRKVSRNVASNFLLVENRKSCLYSVNCPWSQVSVFFYASKLNPFSILFCTSVVYTHNWLNLISELTSRCKEQKCKNSSYSPSCSLR